MFTIYIILNYELFSKIEIIKLSLKRKDKNIKQIF